jgi:hypothetical protein
MMVMSRRRGMVIAVEMRRMMMMMMSTYGMALRRIGDGLGGGRIE